MTDTNLDLTMAASHVIRLYLWDKLQQRLPAHWKKVTAAGMLKIPIVPAQEQPELQDSGAAYIVYVYDYGPTGDLWQLENERLTLRVFSENAAVLSETTKLCRRLFNKWDESAMEVNRWLYAPDGLEKYKTGTTEYDQWMDEARNFLFKSIKVSGTQGVQPAPDEGGRTDTLIFLDLTYVEKQWSPDEQDSSDASD